MTAPLDLSDDEREILRVAVLDEDDVTMRLLQKLSDARAALRALIVPAKALQLADGANWSPTVMTAFVEAERLTLTVLSIAGTTAPVAVPATERKFTGGGTRNTVPAASWRTALAAGVAAPDPVQAAYAECARVARRSHGWEVAESIALEIESAAARARGGK